MQFCKLLLNISQLDLQMYFDKKDIIKYKIVISETTSQKTISHIKTDLPTNDTKVIHVFQFFLFIAHIY